VLDGTVQGTRGMTPFLRFGNAPAVLAALVLVAVGGFWSRRRPALPK
jgi:apolipoprotein N-acyltransferase